MFKQVKVLVALACMFSLAGCKNEEVPPGSVVKFAPESVTWDVDANYTVDRNEDGINDDVCLVDEGWYHDSYVIANLADRQGRPLNDFNMRLHLDLAGNTFSGIDVLKLYEDKNSNGVIDGEHEFISAPGDDGWLKKTDANGDVHMLVRVNLSCDFSGNLIAFGGLNAHAVMNFKVNAK